MLKTRFCRKTFSTAWLALFLVGLFSFEAFAQGGDPAQLVKAFDELPQVFVSPTKRNVTESEKSLMLEALNTSETLKKQADEARAKGNYAEAVRLSLESARAVNTIIKLFPDNKLALLLRATKERNILLDLIKANAPMTLAQKVNHQNNALRYVEAAIIVQPNDPETHYLKARIYEDTADYYLPPAPTSYGSSSSFLDSRPATPVAKPKEYAENLTKALEAAQKAAAVNSTSTKFPNLVNILQNKLNSATKTNSTVTTSPVVTKTSAQVSAPIKPAPLTINGKQTPITAKPLEMKKTDQELLLGNYVLKQKQASNLYDAKSYEAALKAKIEESAIMSKLIQNQPQNADFRYQRAKAELELISWSSMTNKDYLTTDHQIMARYALDEYNAAIALKPDNDVYLYEAALVYNGLSTGAFKDLTAAFSDSNETPEDRAQSKADCEKARVLIDKALKIKPQKVEYQRFRDYLKCVK